jgi:hypothetical protein
VTDLFLKILPNFLVRSFRCQMSTYVGGANLAYGLRRGLQGLAWVEEDRATAERGFR